MVDAVRPFLSIDLSKQSSEQIVKILGKKNLKEAPSIVANCIPADNVFHPGSRPNDLDSSMLCDYAAPDNATVRL